MTLQYHFEALFRSEEYALVDNACREYLFLTEFFKVRGAQAMDIFNQVQYFFIYLFIFCQFNRKISIIFNNKLYSE